MAIFGKLENVRQLFPADDIFQTAFDYLERALKAGTEENSKILSLKDGDCVKTELGKSVFAMEQAYTTTTREGRKYESHKKHIDVQCVVSGIERIEVADARGLTAEAPYDGDSDVVFYKDNSPGSVLLIAEGELAIFYPQDAHIPGLSAGEAETVRKIVVKIPLQSDRTP